MDFEFKPTPDDIFGSFISYKITPDTWVLSFMEGSQYLYLLEGEEKALLIDTGWGASTLKPLVERLTDKPIIVINTHFHPDHAGGNAYFEEVLVGRNYKVDEPSVLGAFSPFDSRNMPYPDYKKVCIGKGDIIDLGNRIIDVFDAKPAHCFSSIFLYDRKNEMFFVGDEFEAGQVNLFDNSANPESGYDIKQCLENFKENALFIKSMSDKIKYLFPNHNGTPMSPSYIDSFIGLVDAIYSGEALIEDKLNHKYLERDPKAGTLCRVRYRDVSVFLNKNLLLTVYGGGIKDEKNVILSKVFSDGMVLQRNMETVIFGEVKRAEHIKVTLNGETVCETDAEAGEFSITLPAVDTLTDAVLTVGDAVMEHVDFGEVWIAGGQSNMEFPLKFDRDKEAWQVSYDEHLKIYTVGQYSFEEERSLGYKKQRHWDKWMCAGSDDFCEVSALSYFAASEFRKKGIPVGIINCSWGSTSASAWVDRKSLEQDDVLRVYTDEYEDLCSKLNMPKYEAVKSGLRAMMNSEIGLKRMEFLMKDTLPPRNEPLPDEMALPGDLTTEPVEPFRLLMWGPKDQNEPGALYRCMLKDIAGFTARGFMWYQGESDDVHADMYDRLFALLIDTWRAEWKKKGNSNTMPFIFVQLAPLGIWNESSGDKYPVLRKAQQNVADIVPEVYMVSNSDLGNVFDIHPKYKKEIGRRVALCAGRHVYGEDVLADAPRAGKASVKNGEIDIKVENGQGLYIKQEDNGSYNGFSVDIIPGKYVPYLLGDVNGLRVIVDGKDLDDADVSVSDNLIKICSDAITDTGNYKIEMGCEVFYRLNVFNEADIPVLPFEIEI